MMRERRILMVMASMAAVLGAGVPAANAAAGGAVPAPRAAAGPGAWGKAMEVPGLVALNKGRSAELDGVSCPSAGNCAAGGDYTDGHHNVQGFVVDERHGCWGKAVPVRGLAALNVAGGAGVEQVSCGSAGNCLAGGSYEYDVNRGLSSSFIVAERRGRWGKAVDLQNDGDVYAISCSSAGNCVAAGIAAGGLYQYPFVGDAFVLEERAGRLGSVELIPGLRKLEHFVDPEIAGSWTYSVACPSAGNCTAGGAYTYENEKTHGFVAVERNGRWDKAIEVPGLAALDKGGNAQVDEVSCGTAGICVAGGSYANSRIRAFVAVERNGSWGTATPVPGLAALSAGGPAWVGSVSCGAAGGCWAGGSFRDRHHHWQGFVASENNGVWDKAVPVPGLAALNKGGKASVGEVSCPSAGYCAAAGDYADRSRHHQSFVIIKRNGTWGKPIPVPGLSALNKGGSASVFSLSCPSPGRCAADGYYSDRPHHYQGFVVTQTR